MSDCDETIGLRERGDRLGTLRDRIRSERTVRSTGQRDYQKFRTPGSVAIRIGSAAVTCSLHSAGRPAKAADGGRDELMERENRRGPKSGQDDQWFAACDRQAHWFAWLQCDAMHHDARIPIEQSTTGYQTSPAPFDVPPFGQTIR
jgi:hypothetical protein